MASDGSPPKPRRRHRRPELSLVTHELIGGRFGPDASRLRGGDADLPEAISWLADGQMLAPSMIWPADEDPYLTSVEMAVSQCGGPQAVASVRVSDEVLAEAVRQVLPGVPVTVGEVPELADANRLWEVLLVHARPTESWLPPMGYLEGGASPETLRALFEAAAELLRADARLHVREPDDIFSVHAPEVGLEHTPVFVLGHEYSHAGIVVFGSPAEARRWRRRPGTYDKDGYGVPVRSLYLVERQELTDQMRADLEAHGWPVEGRRATPLPLREAADGSVEPATDDDVRVLTAACLGVARFFAERGKSYWMNLGSYATSGTWQLDALPGRPRVWVSEPYPGMRKKADLRDMELVEAWRAELGWTSEDAPTGALGTPWWLQEFLLRERRKVPPGWSPPIIEAFLLEFCPLWMQVADEEVDAVPEQLDRFVAWLGRVGWADADLVSRMRDRIAASVPRYREAMAGRADLDEERRRIALANFERYMREHEEAKDP